MKKKKKGIAYTFTSHMSFIIMGIGSTNEARLNRAILQIIFHGFMDDALCFLVGITPEIETHFHLHYQPCNSQVGLLAAIYINYLLSRHLKEGTLLSTSSD